MMDKTPALTELAFWFRSFSEQGRSYASTKRHINSFTELEFEIAAWSLLDSSGGGRGVGSRQE